MKFIIKTPFPEYLEVRLNGAEGPAKDGSDEKIAEYLITLK